MNDILKKQIEEAFHFRGHVTLRLKDGTSAEGYLFNRWKEEYVELMLKGSGDRRKFPIPAIQSVTLTGEDCAAGNSYEDYLKKKAKDA